MFRFGMMPLVEKRTSSGGGRRLKSRLKERVPKGRFAGEFHVSVVGAPKQCEHRAG
jgi:hypothetical protein